MIESCYTRSLWSLPRKYTLTILSLCDDNDFPKVVIIQRWRFTFWTKHDPVMIEKLQKKNFFPCNYL